MLLGWLGPLAASPPGPDPKGQHTGSGRAAISVQSHKVGSLVEAQHAGEGRGESSSRSAVRMAAAPRACGSHLPRPPGLVPARARTTRRRLLRERQLHRLRGEAHVVGEQAVVQRLVCEDAGVQCVLPTAAQAEASSLTLDLERLRRDMAAVLRRADAAEAVVVDRDEQLARLRAVVAEEAVQSQMRTG